MDGMRVTSAELDPAPFLRNPGLLHPAFSALVAGTVITAGPPGMVQGVRCPAPSCLLISPGLPADDDGRAILRFGLELAWLVSVPGLVPQACLVLAGRAAGGFLACLPSTRPPGTGCAAGLFRELAGTAPDIDRLGTAIASLRAIAVLDEAAFPCRPDALATAHAQIRALWTIAQSCETHLVAGGDDRLKLDPATALNRYGCTAWPRPDLIAFGSSTASSISPQGLEAAEALRQRLVAGSLRNPREDVLEEHLAEIGAAILEYFGVPDFAEALLTASGTDAALVVTALLQAEHAGAPLTSILMSPAETGSGVPEAVRARHFATCTASGAIVPKGAALDHAAPETALRTIALRDDDGTPRPQALIRAECDAAIRESLCQGRVVLHAIDGSKTGLSAPDREGCVALAARHGDGLDIVIDACQARLEPALVRFYLQHGFPVLVTGSKFFAAPGFCGAILFPKARLRRIARSGRLAEDIGFYASLSQGMPQRRCPGLLLRWAAALREMRRLHRMPTNQIRQGIERFGFLTRSLIMRDQRLALVAAPRPAGSGWSGRRSVLTFAVHHDGVPMGMDRLREIYLAMADDGGDLPVCQTGQPVAIGQAGMAGLRVALSASQIIGGQDLAAPLATVFTKLGRVLDRRGRMG